MLDFPQKAKRLFFEGAGKRLLTLCALLAAGLLSYAPALNGQLLWDDLYLVGENPFFKSPIFVVEVFKHYLYLDSISLYYRPVQNLSYILDYWIWAGNPFGYHLSNILYHIFSSFLLYLLLRKLLASFSPKFEAVIAFLVAMVWVVHPIHNAAVAYVAGRADSLATIFAITAWLLYLKGRGAKLCHAFHAGAAIALLLALCSKEIAFIWMALFLVYIFGFERKGTLGSRIYALVTMLGVLACYLALRAWPATRPAGQGAIHSTAAERATLMFRALGDYVSLMVWPDDLHMDRIIYTMNGYRNATAWIQAIRFEYLSIIGLAAVCAAIFMCWIKRPGREIRLLGALWFLLGFLPISNLFPLNAQVAEHWIYMPSMGLLLFLAGCACAAPARMQGIVVLLSCLSLVPLGMRTAARSYEWAEPERFYKQTIAAGGGTPRVHLNLALIYTKMGRDAEAEKILREAVARFPDYATARINLGICLVKLGKAEEAESYLRYDAAKAETLSKTYPHTWSAALNLAKLRNESQKPEEALAILEDAIKLHPDIWELAGYKAQILKDRGETKRAFDTLRTYAANNWWHYESRMMLGRLAIDDGDNPEAIAAFAEAGPLDIHASEPFNLTARVQLRAKHPQEAYLAELKAIRRNPDQPSQYLFLSAILDELHRPAEAREAVKRAEELANDARRSGAAL